MRRYRNARNWQGVLAAIVFALAPSGAARAEEERAPPIWQAVDAIGEAAPITDLQALVLMFPDSASARRRLLNAYLEADRPADALDEAVELVKRGYVFSAAAQALLLGLDPSDEQRAALSLQVPNGAPLEASELLASMPAEAELAEGLAWDGKDGLLFASTVVSRALYQRDRHGSWRRIEFTDSGSLSGLVFDAANEVLWVASGVFEQTPHPETAFRGLIGFVPGNGETIRIPAPAGATPSDLAVAADGTLYASDPLSGAIYVLHRGARSLEVWIAPGTFRSPQGLVPWDGGVIVSDYGYGLAFVAGDGRVWRIEADEPVLLDGIDGMWRRGETIVAVQNGARPMRIVELTMAPDGRRIRAMRELERAHRAWTEPVGATIAGDRLVYIATGQWDRFGEGGAVAAGKQPVPSELRTLALTPPPSSAGVGRAFGRGAGGR